MASRRSSRPEDHDFEPDEPRGTADPRTDPAAGIRYDSLERRRPTSGRRSIALGIAAIVLIIALAVVIIAL